LTYEALTTPAISKADINKTTEISSLLFYWAGKNGIKLGEQVRAGRISFKPIKTMRRLQECAEP
jgi:hypothetical protein